MANFGQSAKDAGEWQSNKEMNIKENSSETDVLSENESSGEDSWRPSDNEQTEATKNSTGAAGQSPAASQKQTGDPGRTPGKAEGEDFDE